MAHERRIARGARWLDKHNPGWEERVNTERLNRDSDTNCVIGQARENFTDFMDRRYLTGWVGIFDFYEKTQLAVALLYPGTWFGIRFSVSHGFCKGLEAPGEWREAWTHEVRSRLNRKRKELHSKIDDEHRKVLLPEEPVYVPTEWEKDAALVSRPRYI